MQGYRIPSDRSAGLRAVSQPGYLSAKAIRVGSGVMNVVSTISVARPLTLQDSL